MDQLKDDKKMDQHFQGVDDGIGGKILPTLPSGYAGSVVDRSLMNASHFSPANSGDTGSFSKIAIADARSTQVLPAPLQLW